MARKHPSKSSVTTTMHPMVVAAGVMIVVAAEADDHSRADAMIEAADRAQAAAVNVGGVMVLPARAEAGRVTTGVVAGASLSSASRCRQTLP